MTFAKKFSANFNALRLNPASNPGKVAGHRFYCPIRESAPSSFAVPFTSAFSCDNVASDQIMDKFWSIFCMPIGVLFCFGPVLVAWWLTERQHTKSRASNKRD